MTVPNQDFSETANYDVALTLSVSPSGAGTATASPGGSTTSSAVYWETPYTYVSLSL